MNIYKQNGYADRMEYLCCLAEDYGLDLHIVMTLASALGENEDFDGLVFACKDVADEDEYY